jgi:hypothetical protein
MLKILKASIHNLFYENRPELNFKPKSNKEMTGKNSVIRYGSYPQNLKYVDKLNLI